MSGAELHDTETLLALISSLLHTPIHDQSVLLEALVQCDGDVERAAQLLNSRAASSFRRVPPTSAKATGKKRKAPGLEAWFEKPRSASSHESTKSSKKIRAEESSKPSSTASSSKAVSSTAHSVQTADDVLPSLPSSQSPTRSPKPSSSAASSSEDKSPTKVKQVTNEQFMSMLRPPNSTDNSIKSGPSKQHPLTLATPEMIAKHVPCTMHTSVLPAELACRLFYIMLDLSRDWDRNKWWLFDRLVESPHKTCFYIRRYPKASKTENVEMDEAAQFWYNGRQTGPSPPFPDAMEEACQYVERVVNAEMHGRQRYPLEYGGEPPDHPDGTTIDTADGRKIIWRANVAASNCYEGTKEGVGFHSDALTYLGPYPTIASLSLGTTRSFRLREVVPSSEKDTRAARTYNIPLPHNSLTIMHASCQEMFKHAIPPQRVLDLYHPQFPPPPDLRDRMTIDTSNARINITFRFFRPDYRPSAIPRCKCGVPCILRPDMKNRYSMPEDDKPSADASPSKGPKGQALRREAVAKYWWTCHAGAQNEGKGCGMWQVMNAKAEGRGPFAGDV